VKRFEESSRRGLLDEAKVKDVYRGVNEEIEEAVRFAEASPCSPRPLLMYMRMRIEWTQICEVTNITPPNPPPV